MAESQEADIVESLSNEGTIPITYCFVYGATVHRWNPQIRCVMQKVHRDNSFALACVGYLHDRGLTCDRQEDIAELAARYQWEGWGLAPEPIPFE